MVNTRILIKIKNVVKAKIKSNKLKKYYIEKSQDGKTHMAIFLDIVIFRIFLTTILFYYLYYKTNTLWFSFIITVQFLLLYIILARKVKNIKLNKNILMINNKVAKDKIHKDYINQTPDSFITTIKDNLEKCNFKDLYQEDNKDIDLIGIFNEKKIGIRCYQYNQDYKVNFNNVREFFLSLRDKNLEEGIIITTSTFSQEARDFIGRLANYKKIVTIDLDGLIGVMKKSGTYPSLKEIEKVILSEIKERKIELLNNRNGVLSRGKGRKYLIISCIIFFFGRLTPYEKYYEIVSIILLTLGIFVFLKEVYNLFKGDSKEDSEYLFENY